MNLLEINKVQRYKCPFEPIVCILYFITFLCADVKGKILKKNMIIKIKN